MQQHDAKCVYCGSNYLKKNGKRNERQRFICLRCGKSFSETTKTIFSSSKLSSRQLKDLIILIIHDTKLETIEDILSMSSRTVYLWRMKIYKLAGEVIKNTMLSSVVWLDEKLITVNKSLLKTKNNGQKFRGQSVNQIVVACAIDSTQHKYAEIAGRGHISSKQCLQTYGKHIKRGSHIIHDGIFSHDRLIKALGATDEIWKSVVQESKKKMQPINSFCSEIERNLVIHLGTRTENLQDYLNWIVFKSTITLENIDEKVAELEEFAFRFKLIYRVKDRYYRE